MVVKKRRWSAAGGFVQEREEPPLSLKTSVRFLFPLSPLLLHRLQLFFFRISLSLFLSAFSRFVFNSARGTVLDERRELASFRKGGLALYKVV